MFFSVLSEAEALDCSQNVLTCFVFPRCCFPLFLGRNVSTVCLETGCRPANPATGFSLPRGKVTWTHIYDCFGLFFCPSTSQSNRFTSVTSFLPQSSQIHLHPPLHLHREGVLLICQPFI